MKPISLQGHSRPIKKVLFSDNGEMLFTASVDRNIISWFASGEKFKSYAHSAAVNTMMLSPEENTYLISGDNTGCTYVWDIKLATLLKKIEHDPILSVRSLHMMDLMLLAVIYAGRTKMSPSFINIYKFDQLMGIGAYAQPKESINYTNSLGQTNQKRFYEGGSIYGQIGQKPPLQKSISNEQLIPVKHFECMTNTSTKYVSGKFVVISSGIKCLLVSREDGFMEMINVNTGKLVFEKKFHEEAILDFDYLKEKDFVLTSSKDGTACLFNLDTLEIIKSFKPENPVRNLNTCKLIQIESTRQEPTSENSLEINVQTSQSVLTCIFAGGQESKLVTTSKQEGGFEVLAYDCLDTVLFNLNAHFGPVNSVDFSKNKMLLLSGSEDSSAKIYNISNIINFDK
jgi:WD40 repeat protein